jgi:linear primary-alkylsulfatase
MLKRHLTILSTILALGAFPALAAERPASSANEKLLSHQSVFQPPRLVQVSEHVTVAYGYTMSNIIMVEGDEGIFIFDTGMRVEKAELALAAFRTRTDKPILGVAYSHGHGDHTGGVRAFIPEGSETDIALYAHRNALRYLGDINSPTSAVFRLRAVEQLGLILPDSIDGSIGSGGGPVISMAGTVSYITPTHLFDDETTVDLGGVSVKLIHAPGDLDDGIAAWIEDDGVLLTGDTVVGTHTYPILSTPRYEKGRSAEAYIASINLFRDFNADHLIGGHGLPIDGKENVARLIDRTHLVARYIMDETLRQINARRGPEEIAANLRVPAHVSGEEEFGDYYHRLNWIVRGVYNKEMGWYSGDTLDLVALAPKAHAEKLIDALGGKSAVLTMSTQAYEEGEFRWAASLATQVLTLDEENEEALSIKGNALRAIAYQSDSANERNYLLSEADLMLGEIGLNVIAGQALSRVTAFFTGPTIPDIAKAGPSSAFIDKFRIRTNEETSIDQDLSITIEVSDREESYQLTLKHGVMIHDRPALRASDATLRLDHRALVLLADAHLSWEDVLALPEVSIEGDNDRLHAFLSSLSWD